MTRTGRPRLSIVTSRPDVTLLTLHDLPFELVPREVPFFLCDTPTGFPSPAQDDMEDPLDLGAWLVEQPAANLHVGSHQCETLI